MLFFTGFNYLEANFPALVSSIAPAGQKGTAMRWDGTSWNSYDLGTQANMWSVWVPNREVAYIVGAKVLRGTGARAGHLEIPGEDAADPGLGGWQ